MASLVTEFLSYVPIATIHHLFYYIFYFIAICMQLHMYVCMYANRNVIYVYIDTVTYSYKNILLG